jgi:hypothetical protein
VIPQTVVRLFAGQRIAEADGEGVPRARQRPLVGLLDDDPPEVSFLGQVIDDGLHLLAVDLD